MQLMSDFSGTPSPPPNTTGGGWRWQPPEPEELQRMLPQFVVESLIGRGGMGAVYKGIQSSLERPVAIKVLPPAIEQQDQAFAERFRNEARLMGRLNHPAIVSVYDFGRTTEGQLYFVMEYVDGTDVQRMIAREGRMLPEHALAVTAHLCDALGYAHKQGIVHRDVKPSNVLIDMEGRVKVADFGLAKLTGAAVNNSGLTQTGMAMGTPDYVAPETLMHGGDVDGRADLYAVGVMLYQMLTGDIPRGVFKMPSQKFQAIDPRFDRIVRRALEQDREERYQTSLELRRDLDVILAMPLAVAGAESSAALPKQQPAAGAPPTPAPGRTVVQGSRNAVSTLPPQGGPVFDPAAHSSPRTAGSSSSLPYVLVVLALLGAGGWFILKDRAPAEATPESTAAVGKAVETPAAPPTSPQTPPARPPQTPTAPMPTPMPRPPATPPPATPVITRVTPPPVPPVRTEPITTAPAGARGTPADRLTELETQFQKAFDREVNGPFNDLISALGTNYLAALERSLAEAMRAGRVDETAALQEEKKRFVTHKFMPSIDPSTLHRSVVRLRNTYRSTEKTYTQQKDATALPLYDLYLGVLKREEADLQAQGSHADAAKVRAKREDVAARRAQRAAKVPAGTAPFPQRASAAPKPPTSTKLALFDGESLNGWRIVGSPGAFSVVEGEIRSNNGQPGNLIYTGTGGGTPSWKDFTLELKVKSSGPSNSGIWLHLPDVSTLINRPVTGFEVNIDERSGGTGTILGAVEVSSGAPLSGRLRRNDGFFGSVRKTTTARYGLWQSLRITTRSGMVTVWIDGEQVNDWALPAGWKPPADKDYVQTTQGTVGLQSNGGSVAFKDILLEPL